MVLFGRWLGEEWRSPQKQSLTPFQRFSWVALTLMATCSVVGPDWVWAKPERSPSPVTQPAPPAASDEADRLLQQGAEHFRRRQWQSAETAWQRTLELYRQSGNRVGEGRVLGNLAAIYDAQGNYPQAIELFQQSLRLARDVDDPRGESFALTNLGYMYKNLGNYAEALRHLEAALPITRAIADQEGEYEVLNLLGTVHRAAGNDEQAIAALEQALALTRAVGSTAGEANALANLANTYTDQGQYPAALEHYQRALSLMRTVQNRVGEAGVLQRLGMLYNLIGNTPRAVEYYTQSLEMAHALGDRRLQAYNLGSLGSAAYKSDQPEQAIPYLQQALSLMQALGDRAAESNVLHYFGNAYMAMGQYETAESYYQQSLDIARDIGDRAMEGLSLGSLATLLDVMHRDDQALIYYRDALPLLREVGDRPGEGRALSNMGIALYEQGDLTGAAEALLAAVAIWESLRPGLSDADQVSLFETQAATYRVLQQVLIDLDRSSDALEISERGRSRAFVELVAQRLSAEAASRLQTPPPTMAQIRQIAREQEATLVQYSILENARLAVWVIQPDGEIQFRETRLTETDLSLQDIAEQTRVAAALGRGNSSDPAFTALVRETRSAAQETRAVQPDTGQTTPRRLSRKLQTLHQLLIEPIADLLPTDPDDQVVIIPSGPLFLVPFAALQRADGTYLIEHHTLRTAPAIQILDLTHTRQLQRRDRPTPTPDQALIIGNPSMPSLGEPPEPLGALPYAEQEAQAIATLLNTQALVGARATEPAVTQLMSNARLIHLATHGLLDDLAGLGVPGALALTPTRTTDGFLTANEILSLSLNQADLVVLSACDTGRGRITGDGVIGLSRSFLSAGAPSVVVSLWAVPDDATAALMTEFYQRLQHGVNKAQALRQAMLATMQDYPSSRDWAAFTLIGEGD